MLEDFFSIVGIADPRGSLSVNIQDQAPPLPVSGFQILTASGGTTKVRGIGFYPGPNGTISGTNQPIVDKLAGSNVTDCSEIVNSSYNYTFGTEVPGYDSGVQRLSFPAIAGYQLIDTPVDIYSKIQNTAILRPFALEVYCVPVGRPRDTPGIFRSLRYSQTFPTSGPSPAEFSVETKYTSSIPVEFNFDGTGTLRSAFDLLRRVASNASTIPGPNAYFFGVIYLFEQ